MDVSIDLIRDFRDDERWKYNDIDQNTFSFALGQVERYYSFMQIITSRYEDERKIYIENSEILNKNETGIRPLTESEAIMLEKSSVIGKKIQLDIESFFVFCKIGIDKIAQFIEGYFGKVRNCSFRSHDRMIKDIEMYITNKNIAIPKRFFELAKDLQKRVSDYRDKQIEHYNNPRRMVGIAWSAKGDMQLSSSYFNPKESDFKQVESNSIDTIKLIFDEYLLCFFEIIKENRKKGKYILRSKD